MLNEHNDTDQPMPRVETCVYSEASASQPAHVYLELRSNRNLNPANVARQRAAEERLDGGTDQVCGSVDNVATRHLQEMTGTRARIIDDGYFVSIQMDLPTDQETGEHRTTPGTGMNAATALRPDQESLLPELTRNIESALPPHERHHTNTLALMVAREIPSAADTIRASDRVTLAEIIEHHEKRIGYYSMMPPPAHFRFTELSFPHHPSAALHHSADTPSPAPAHTAHTAQSRNSAPDLER